MSNFKVYLVGGAVRDRVLGRACRDRDYVVVGATPKEMLELGYKQVGKDFPVFLHPETGEEYALARKEVKTGDKHTDFEFVFTPDVTLREDLERRDLTCNALAQDMGTYEIIDYFGGLRDTNAGILRHTSEHFIEDPLRILRCLRLACQLEFSIHESTKTLLKSMIAEGVLKHLTKERVWKEIEKVLFTPNMHTFIELLDEMGALGDVFPEVEALKSIPENVKYHPEGTAYKHTLIALSRVKSAVWLKAPGVHPFRRPARILSATHQAFGSQPSIDLVNFGVLCHDLGKALTPEEEWPAHHGHDENGIEIVKRMCARLKVPNKYLGVGLLACKYHMKLYEFLKTKIKTQYDFVKEVSNFKSAEDLAILFDVHYCDLFGRAEEPDTERQVTFQEVRNQVKRIYYIMENVTLDRLPVETQEKLKKFKGEQFGKLYRDAMISYLKGVL